MVENGIYIIKEEYFIKFKKMGSKFKDNKSGRRPTFCCVRDKYIKDMFWAIPASKITKDKNIERIKKYINSKTSNIQSSFYHLRKKLKRILQAENKNPNRFEQRITDIKKELIKEI